MVISILYNLSKKYYNHNSNIKCVNSIIKYIVFKSFYYIICLDVVLLFMIFKVLIIYFY